MSTGRRSRRWYRTAILRTLSIVTFCGVVGDCWLGRSPVVVVKAQGSTCTLQRATTPLAFCETFDAPAGNPVTRTGDLNPVIWGVSRTIGNVNFGQQQYNAAPATLLVGCTGTTTVRSPNDVMICNGQLREATNDAGGVTALAMYPKQPFDFAGRTGVVGFDVSNDSHGTHATWPEFWMTDKPVPAPFAHFDSWKALPQFGFGVRFAGFTDSNGQETTCPEGNGYVGVDSAIVVNDYVGNDTASKGTLVVKGLDCVKQATSVGQLNHYEIGVSQNQIDVYGTDAGKVKPLKHLATIAKANLGFTRGLIWINDVHYNADKASNDPSRSQRQHTFAWDNVAFDGPLTYHDLSYDAPDNTTPNSDGTVNLGRFSGPNQSATWDVLGMPSNPAAAGVRVLFNFYGYTEPTVLNVTVNGHEHPTPWPYPDTQGYMWRTYAVSIPITDLVPGTNIVTLGGDQPLVTSNVNIVLVDAKVAQP
jgi:hypothetical protein